MREVIARALAQPSVEIALACKGTEVVLKDGGVIHGITFNNSNRGGRGALPLPVQPAGEVTQLISPERIEKTRGLKRSLMYDPTTPGPSAQDIADLAARLQESR